MQLQKICFESASAMCKLPWFWLLICTAGMYCTAC